MIDALSVASGVGCEAQSWAPEVFSLYGDPDTVSRKLDKIDMDLPGRRIFIFTLESREGAELAFYERTSKDKVSVSRWTGAPRPRLHEAVSQAIIDACIASASRPNRSSSGSRG